LHWGSDEEITGEDRFKSCIPYVLPLLDGDSFGYYIYQRIPPLRFVDDIFIAPLVHILDSLPFFSLLLFLILSIGSRNANLSRAVRFNAQQAVLIDIALIFPALISETFRGQDVPRYVAEPASNFVYYAYMAAIVYCVSSNLSGKKPNQIPWISDVAEMATGPF